MNCVLYNIYYYDSENSSLIYLVLDIWIIEVQNVYFEFELVVVNGVYWEGDFIIIDLNGIKKCI